MNKEQFNLSDREWETVLPSGFREPIYYKKDIKEFVKILIEFAEENDWEVGIDDGEEDGFIVISGKEFITKLAGKSLT